MAGAIAGCEIVDVKVTLCDGSYYEGDSDDAAFESAGFMAVKEAMPQANPVLLEPVMSLELSVLSVGLRNRKILSGIGEGNDPLQGFAVVPRYPLRGISLHFLSMTLQLGQVVEGVGVAQLTSVNQAHEQITHVCPIQRPIEQGILPVENSSLQCALDNIIV
jgi:hypothetical protein